ncbi:MAG: SDR family oxidoreductase [Planctomycetales bacterium]|nr:SDR family oxidoreductase [Planctomycetales bacterium]
MPTNLSGQAAVVTGAASGIGRAISIALAAAGADILLHTRIRREALVQVAEELEQFDTKTELVVGDLADHDEREALVTQAWNWRAIDIWVNNAGADVLTGEAAAGTFDDKLAQLQQVDVNATIDLSRSVGARMKASGAGVICNIGWDQAESGMAGDGGEMFAATKGAIAAFSRSLAKSLAPQVRVNCLAPGWIRTAWGEQASDTWQQRAMSESLLGRWGTPADVARACRFLVSPESAFITGQVIKVNGGSHVS